MITEIASPNKLRQGSNRSKSKLTVREPKCPNEAPPTSFSQLCPVPAYNS